MEKNMIKNSDFALEVFVKIILISTMLIALYPFIYVASMSFSSSEGLLSGKVWFYPIGFSLKSYKTVLSAPDVLLKFYNTIWYTVVGTICSVSATIFAAYPLSRKDFFGRTFFMKAIIFTMYFSGGMVPTYMIVREVGLLSPGLNKWSLVLPVLVSSFNLIIARSFFETISDSLIESARIDGANDLRIFFKIIIPVSIPIIAVLTIFYAVDRWNAYFNALLYIRDQKLHPIQLYLRNVLTLNQTGTGIGEAGSAADKAAYSIQVKYSLIMITILPIIFIYPFAQKYFVKGVMIGSVKE